MRGPDKKGGDGLGKRVLDGVLGSTIVRSDFQEPAFLELTVEDHEH